jgi:phosphatidylinositol glycan class A protein
VCSADGSFVDILYLGRIFPKHAAIMAKKSIKWIPGLGWFSECNPYPLSKLTPVMLSGAVFINRSNTKSAIAAMQQAGEDMKGKRVSRRA